MSGDEITVSSTDGEIEVSSTHSEQTAEAAESQPEPSPGGIVTVISSTDTQQAVSEAARAFGREHDAVVEGEAVTELIAPPIGSVASTTDSKEAVAEVEKDLEEQRERQADEYLGRTDKRLQRQFAPDLPSNRPALLIARRKPATSRAVGTATSKARRFRKRRLAATRSRTSNRAGTGRPLLRRSPKHSSSPGPGGSSARRKCRRLKKDKPKGWQPSRTATKRPNKNIRTSKKP